MKNIIVNKINSLIFGDILDFKFEANNNSGCLAILRKPTKKVAFFQNEFREDSIFKKYLNFPKHIFIIPYTIYINKYNDKLFIFEKHNNIRNAYSSVYLLIVDNNYSFSENLNTDEVYSFNNKIFRTSKFCLGLYQYSTKNLDEFIHNIINRFWFSPFNDQSSYINYIKFVESNEILIDNKLGCRTHKFDYVINLVLESIKN